MEKEFEALINANKGIIYKVARLYADTAADRQDLVQEIVLQFWKTYPKFRNEAKVSTWLYRIALNTAISGLRKEKKAVVTFVADLSQLDIMAVTDDDQSEKQLQMLYAAIGRLNEIDTALVMLYLDDKSYDEIEEIIGINQGALRVRINRIKEKLRQLTKN